jgi:hypothetical protein
VLVHVRINFGRQVKFVACTGPSSAANRETSQKAQATPASYDLDNNRVLVRILALQMVEDAP